MTDIDGPDDPDNPIPPSKPKPPRWRIVSIRLSNKEYEIFNLGRREKKSRGISSFIREAALAMAEATIEAHSKFASEDLYRLAQSMNRVHVALVTIELSENDRARAAALSDLDQRIDSLKRLLESLLEQSRPVNDN